MAGGWNLRVDSLAALRAGDDSSAPAAAPVKLVPHHVFAAAAPAAAPAAAAAVAVSGYTPPPPGAKLFTLADIAAHDTTDDVWILVKDKVYDASAYIKAGGHPGGNASITMNAGQDTTEDFEAGPDTGLLFSST